MEKPDATVADLLRRRIVEVWSAVPKPYSVINGGPDMTTMDLHRYFEGRDVADVDLSCGPLTEAPASLVFLTEEAVHYYIRAYLLHVLDLKANENGCADAACLTTFAALCCAWHADHPMYTVAQAECIRDVLKLMERYIEFYYVHTEERLEALWRAMDHWSAYVDDLQAGRIPKRQPPACPEVLW